MIWLKKIFTRWHNRRPLTTIQAQKTNEKLNKVPKTIQCNKEGFTVTYKEFSKKLTWTEITKINVFKTDLLTTDRIDMEIEYGDKSITISEELPGWQDFLLKIKEIYPSISKDWDTEIVQPPFGLNYKTIYKKD